MTDFNLNSTSRIQPIVELSGVGRRYLVGDRSLDALSSVDFAVNSGEFLSIVGPSGSGKSTLLNILGCLDRPTSGRYFLEGNDVTTFDDVTASDLRNRRIGFVFQSFHLLPRLSALENVVLPSRFYRGDITNFEGRGEELLARMGLASHLSHRPGQLSGGQVQRVAIARALLMRPAIVLADEPTGNLDSKSAREVMRLLGEIHEEGQTIILVTHDRDVAAYSDRTLTLRDGVFDRNDT